MKVICIGNFPPRKCGIATFTENLVKSIVLAANNNSKELELELVAMNDKGKDYDYPPVVKHVIRVGIKGDYLKIAGYINNESNADLCLFQHEYGIYGGESGLFVLNLLKRVRVPIVSTFHTVLQKPTFHQREVLQKIGEYSSRVVVMSSLAIEFLVDVYKMPRSKIARIEHGVPDFAKVSEQSNIKPVEWIDRKILLTFGLLSRNKGIETVIKALPSVVEKFPETLYVVLGKTHPHVVEFAGEEYRDYLKQLTADLNLADHVLFLDKYVSEEELMNYLLASDIYVTPYLNKAQITSGTLAYAVSGGSAVISTPYWHAVELLADGRGRLFNFGDYKQLAEIINDLLANPKTLDTMKKEAYNYGLLVAWPKIGAEYLGVFEKVFLEKQNNFENGHRKFLFSIPDFHLSHLENLTDDTGIVQHARACIPNYNTGYCLDDNTRALIVCLMAYHRFGDIKYLKLISRYLAYIMYMQNSDGSFKNYLTYWRTTIEEIGSDDAYG
nr:glycosyltransferase [Bacteroidota bacterium]